MPPSSTTPSKPVQPLEPARSHKAVIDEYKHRRDSSYVRKDIFNICPRMAETRRAPTSDLRSALLPVKKHLSPADTPGSEDALGRAGEAPEGRRFMESQTCEAGSRDWQVALESVGRMRLSRAPHMEFKSLLAPTMAPRGRPLEYFRLVAKETDNTLVEALAGGARVVLRSPAHSVHSRRALNP